MNLNVNPNLQIEPTSKDVPDSPRPSEGSVYKSLTPQEEVFFSLLSVVVSLLFIIQGEAKESH